VLILALVSGACGKSNSKPESTEAMSESTIPVDGMSCNRCASRVQKLLTSLDGVDDAEVSLEQKRAVVHFDPQRTSPAKLASAIDQAGFKTRAPSEASRRRPRRANAMVDAQIAAPLPRRRRS
jgi:copper chaperone